MRTLPSINIGSKFGKLTYVQSLGINEKGHSVCEVKCDCGNTKTVKTAEFISGHVKTCGCGSWIGKSKSDCAEVVGKKYGLVTVLEIVGVDEKHYKICRGKCDCGTEKVFRVNQLLKGMVRSCGCLLRNWRKKNLPHISRTFGLPGVHRLSHNSWSAMIQRCFNKNAVSYPYYGGRGIKVCEFLKENVRNLISLIGERPSKEHSIDRINSDLNYSCGQCDECKSKVWSKNVQWSDKVSQANNRRNNVRVTIGGVTKSIAEWANEMQLSYKKAAHVLKIYAP